MRRPRTRYHAPVKMAVWILSSLGLLLACRSEPEVYRNFEGANPASARGSSVADLVELIRIDPSLRLDIRYATANNFVGRPVYPEARAFLQRPAAEALSRVQARLSRLGYGLLVFDGYRPWTVTKLFWEVTPPPLQKFVADPAQGSKHNRGCAVDLTLCDLETGVELAMPTAFDDFTDAAAADAPCASALAKAHRSLLRTAMEAEGFQVYEHEWWHFDFQDWRRYPILDLSFAEIDARGN